MIFASAAKNLVPGDTNHRIDVFMRDLGHHSTLLVSRGRAGAPANGDSRPKGISSFGRHVAYDSSASNLVAPDTNGQYDVVVRDIATTGQDRISVSTDGAQANEPSYRPAISGAGRFVAFDSYATNLVPTHERRFGRLSRRPQDGQHKSGYRSNRVAFRPVRHWTLMAERAAPTLLRMTFGPG